MDPYIDWNHKYYQRHKDYYDSNVWNGSHYGLYNSVMAVNTVYYNKKMFEDAGLETLGSCTRRTPGIGTPLPTRPRS